MKMTKHFKERMDQRWISDTMVHLVLALGLRNGREICLDSELSMAVLIAIKQFRAKNKI